MRTAATDLHPAIEWDRGEKVDNHDQLTEYIALGESDDGRTWSGSWNQIGEDVEIENIEEA